MIRIFEDVPHSLYRDLSERLVTLLKEAPNMDAIPTDILKKIIYLWQLDQLATETGIRFLVEAAIFTDVESTYNIFNELGLQGIIKIEN